MSIVGNAVTNDVLLQNMKGLLGNNDGNSSNDFVARNGTLYDASSSEENIWSFGTSCKTGCFTSFYFLLFQ